MTALLKAKGLKKTYRMDKILLPALQGITFDVEKESLQLSSAPRTIVSFYRKFQRLHVAKLISNINTPS